MVCLNGTSEILRVGVRARGGGREYQRGFNSQHREGGGHYDRGISIYKHVVQCPQKCFSNQLIQGSLKRFHFIRKTGQQFCSILTKSYLT